MQFSIWEKETFLSPQDVIIIGSGFVGLWSAFYLKRKAPSLKISIIDRGLIPTGASSRNAGFACFGSLSELIYDGCAMGTDKMLELVEMRFRGLEKIRKHFGDRIDFEMCGGYELYEQNKISGEQLKENIQYLNLLLKPVTGAKKTYSLADDKIDSFGFGHTQHLVKNELEGYQHSGKLLQQLLHTVQGMGVQVFTGVDIQQMRQLDNKVHLVSGQELEFTTKQLLLCTNALTKNLVPEIDIIPARGQVLLTTAVPDLPWKGTFHSDEGYYYFRNIGNKVLLGGARNKAFTEEETTDISTSEFIQRELERYLSDVVIPRFRGKYTIEHRWAGIMAMGTEKIPIVKQLDKNIYCAVRMGGMGVALAPVVAQDITSKMLKA